MPDRKLAFGRTTAADRAAITIREAHWPEIAELFRSPTRRTCSHAQYESWTPKKRAHSKNTGLFFGGRCSDGHRGDNTLVSRSIVNLDLDDHVDAIWQEFKSTGEIAALSGWSYLVHTTRSHTGDAPKLRILVPLARDVSPAEYEPVARGIAVLLDEQMLAAARESFTPAQGMYFPSVSSDQPYRFASFEGELCDPDPILVKYPAGDASRWPKRAKEQVTEYRPGRKMTHPEDKKSQAPIIAAVHRAFDPWTFIDEFLDDIYIASGDRYYPVGATGAPSVRVYDDAFIQSDHGSDPAVGQHNTFDLGRIHLFRHLDDDFEVAGMSPADWPSYKAMVDFMLKQPAVKEALMEVEAEVAANKAQEALDLLSELGDLDDDDDLIGSADPYDDLIGEPVPTVPTIEDVLAKVRKTINNATTLSELDRRLEKIRAIPTATFKDFHRDMVVKDLQAKLKEITGDSISKPSAKKMLAPTIENLRDQMASEPMPDWLENWVFVTGENAMMNTVTKVRLSKEAFNGRFNKNTGDQFGANEMGVAKLSAFDAATQVLCVPVADAIRYHPGQADLFEEDGLQYANTYRAPLITTSAYKGSKGVKYLLRLLADLFPEPKYQQMVLDFITHCVRYPAKKLRYAMLIKGAENEGKSLLGTLVGRLVGASNFGIVGSDQLTEKFNGWSFQRTFVMVEEIKLAGRDAPMVLNKLKPVMTNSQVPIRRMQKDVSTEDNFCNIYLTTNYEDCLPMEEDNTRYLVLFTRFQTNEQVKKHRASCLAKDGFDYVSKLYEHIMEHPHQFVAYFQEREFSDHYDPDDRAPMTSFKKRMAEDAKTDERQLLEDIVSEGKHPAINARVLLWPVYRELLDIKGLAPRLKGRGVGTFLKTMGFVRTKRITRRTDGAQRYIYAWTKDYQALSPLGEPDEDLKKDILEADIWAEEQEAETKITDLM